jgi:DNA-nicking Smr family endonuclease
MSKEKKPKDDGLFKEAVQDIDPISQDRAPPYRKKVSPHPRPQTDEKDELEADIDIALATDIKAGDLLQFSRPGVQDRLVKDLRRGRIEIGLELDLHGLTIRLAKAQLELCLQECRARNIRCLHIIHGKGFGSAEQQPVLKQQLNIWLQQKKSVLAFCSATQRDGGTGAVYVLLRNPNKHGR